MVTLMRPLCSHANGAGQARAAWQGGGSFGGRMPAGTCVKLSHMRSAKRGLHRIILIIVSKYYLEFHH